MAGQIALDTLPHLIQRPAGRASAGGNPDLGDNAGIHGITSRLITLPQSLQVRNQ
jgi:hypothetical protein